MADSSFQSYRSRDPATRGADSGADADPPDPLAELARLIGQSGPGGDGHNHNARRDPAAPGNGAAAASDWRAEDEYAGEDPPVDDRYVTPRSTEAYRPYPPAAAPDDLGYDERPAAAPYFGATPESDDAHGRESAGPMPGLHHGDAVSIPRGPQMPFLPTEPYDDRDIGSALPHDSAEDYSADDYQDYDEASPGLRWRGSVIVAAVVGLVFVGAASAFAYRTMFGGSMLPSLPPIIKASPGPNKIVPSTTASQSAASGQGATGTADSNDQLVSHAEQPVDVQQLVKPAPRVVSTIPIFPDPSAPSPVPQPPPDPNQAPASSAYPISATPTPGDGAGANSIGIIPEPKKIRTVIIRPDADGGTNTAAAPPPMPVPAPTRPIRMAAAHPETPKPRLMPRAHSGENAPLGILPSEVDNGNPTPSSRWHQGRESVAALTPPPARTGPLSGGSYAVQVSSQRTAADAHAVFRTLQARFPSELRGREPIIRRADLGAKGVYYRTLVGPFASMEQAAGMCSKMKAAGGTCIVERD